MTTICICASPTSCTQYSIPLYQVQQQSIRQDFALLFLKMSIPFISILHFKVCVLSKLVYQNDFQIINWFVPFLICLIIQSERLILKSIFQRKIYKL